MKTRTTYQPSLFDSLDNHYKINKPIRIIEFFGGIGFTHLGYNRVFSDLQQYKLVEWAVPSIIGYDAVHYGDCDCSAISLSHGDMVDRLFALGVSTDYDKPATIKQIDHMSDEKLKRIICAIERTHNLVNIMNVHGDDLEVVDTDKYEYVLSWSFPCQDLSLAGNSEGMSVSQAEGGTRSGLCWEVIRILGECKEKPQVLIMENVPQVHSVENLPDFLKIQRELEALGYVNYWQDMNGTDYGVPQHRIRTFMVSIYDPNREYSFTFPHPSKLNKCLNDLLESCVDEKYYLSDKMINYISAPNDKWTGNNNGAIVNRSVGCALNTKPDGRRCDASNYIADGLPNDSDIQLNRELCNRLIESGEVKPGDIIKHDRCSQIMEGKKKPIEKSDGTCITVTTRGATGLRIRKLTPLECLRLMGADDYVYDRLVAGGLSDSQIYHIAGDGLIANIPELLIKQMKED